MTQTELEALAAKLLALRPQERLYLGERLLESSYCTTAAEHEWPNYDAGSFLNGFTVHREDIHDDAR